MRVRDYRIILCMVMLGFAASVRGSVSEQNVVWDSPSKNEHGSMPIGNGDLAANVWLEPGGDLVFYISKSDAWSGNGRLLKLGRVRIKTVPALFSKGDHFRQELQLEDGTISFKSGGHTVLFWIDANAPVINVEIASEKPVTATAALELWRTARRELKGQESVSAYGIRTGNVDPYKHIFVEPDTVLPAVKNSIRWYHRNNKSCYDITLSNQHLGDLIPKTVDPLMNLTFGGSISAAGMVNKDDITLVTKQPAKKLHIKVNVNSEQTATPEEWVSKLNKLCAQSNKISVEKARRKHVEYWHKFWDRSRIIVKDRQSAGVKRGSSDADIVTRAYVLQRWMLACAGRGKYPIKFNGSLFTVAAHDKGNWNADYRRWGGCYWFQNTRLAYWPMLAAGDFEQMQPFWRMYRNALPLLKARTKTYFNHDGLFCSETMYFWGTYNNANFGWGNKGMYTVNNYVRYYWDSGNELSMMMLDYYRYTPDDRFAKNTLVPLASEIVTFYEQHFKRDADGKIFFSPAMSLETWHTAENPLPIIIGLKTVISGLLELPHKLTTKAQRKQWKRVLSELPEIPIEEKDGKKRILPASKYSNKKNSENPELYAVFPYRAYTLHKPDLDVAIETWKRRRVKRTGGWTQDAIQAALLGLTDTAKSYVISNAKSKDRSSRFPAFWGPNFDWIPDQDHGSVTMIALQRMLMQCDGKKIYLLPAWPQDWDVDFKLHAPLRTTVEGRVEKGKIVDLKVTPKSRRKDIVIKDQ